MRAVIRTWWAYGTRTRWTARDYLRHYAYVASALFVGTAWLIAGVHG